jgi:hypothetical protein
MRHSHNQPVTVASVDVAVSQYVTEAVTRQLELDLLAELTELLTSQNRPVSRGVPGGGARARAHLA